MNTLYTPSKKTLLLLKQLAIPRQVIEASIRSFENMGQGENSDKAFVNYVVNTDRLEDSGYATVKKAARIPILWHESNKTKKELLALGYDAQLIDDYRDLFIIQSREQGALIVNPDYCFHAFCIRRPKNLARQIPNGWYPSAKTLKQITAKGGSLDHVKVFVLQFRVLWQENGQARSDWDQMFLNEFFKSAN